MKCKNCGGELIFKDNIFVCCSCDSKLNIDARFENNDVCICYIENDEKGRRTKDSIIAEEVYKKLESKEINTFYERISASEMVGDDLELLRYAAIVNSKIIILVGTNGEVFSKLLQKVYDIIQGKRIIPVISGMKPEELPNEIIGYQASNFDAIGALNDLSISALNMLGRGKEVEVAEIYNKQLKKKKAISAVIVSVISIILCAAIIFAVVFFGDEKEMVVTDEDIYNSALQMVDDGKYFEAISEFNKIINYKDSVNQIKKIYDRYDGYYLDESQTYSLYLNIVEGKSVEFVFKKIIGDKIIKIEEVITLDGNVAAYDYIDSLSNKGEFSITLTEETILVSVTTKEVKSKLSLGDLSVQFLIKNKMDRPVIEAVTNEKILNWMSGKTSLYDIKTFGYSLEFVSGPGDGWDPYGLRYRISNTDVILYFLPPADSNIDSSTTYIERNDYILSAVTGPAEVVCPTKIGKESLNFVEGNLSYHINLKDVYDVYGDSTYFDNTIFDSVIKNSTIVTVMLEGIDY